MGTTNRQLSVLQRRILSVLEEAGEDDLAALTNTVCSRTGSADEISDVAQALLGLMGDHLIAIARFRDSKSLEWIPLPNGEPQSILSELEMFLQWMGDESLWKWDAERSRLEVILTKLGKSCALKVISEDGWYG